MSGEGQRQGDTRGAGALALAPRWPLRLAALAGVLLYAWIGAGTRPFTWQAYVATGVPVALAFTLAARHGGRRQPLRDWMAGIRDACARARRRETRPPATAGVVAWALLTTLVVAWELFNLFQQPRSAHPTISSVVELLSSTHFGRFILFLLWLGLGWQVLRR